MENTDTCQIKICGLTDPEQAAACADMGASAIGLVFYPKSRRCVHPDQAARISRALPQTVARIGVFVDEPVERIRKTAEKSGLTGVQLHGREGPEIVEELHNAGLFVIKGLYVQGEPSIADAAGYGADAYLVECAAGAMPGGNAMAWNWAEAADFGRSHPFILAGGLAPENAAEAIRAARPDGVDVSSAVEAAPGQKSISSVQAFIAAVKQCACTHPIRRIFYADTKPL